MTAKKSAPALVTDTKKAKAIAHAPKAAAPVAKAGTVKGAKAAAAVKPV
jgi:hypothetical protein